MLFNSIEFLIFFPIVITAYFLLPHRFRWFWLLSASVYFYMRFIPIYILVLFFLIIVDYTAGLLISAAKTPAKKRTFLIMSLCANIGILGFFKYFNFFNSNIDKLATLIGWNYPLVLLTFALPIGLSFHTFQSISYVIEVYKGNYKVEKNCGIYALYVMFFPQLVAGPIERPQNLLHQLHEKHNFDFQRVANGLKLMLWGFFKKLVIADRVAMLVNTIYSNPTSYTGTPLILATFLFAFQIFCDFSGYSDIAIGAARVMGVNLMYNFRRPYFSKSISEFWKRWHISLSSWFRDYLYFPLGGSRVSLKRVYFNLFITFLISGMWHGANWTFLAWGALHGFYVMFERATSEFRKKLADKLRLSKLPRLHAILQIIITFILADIAWIFFRANTISDAFYILTHLFSGLTLNLSSIDLGLDMPELAVAFAAIIFMEIVHLIQERIGIMQFMSQRAAWLRWIIYALLLLGVLLFGVFKGLTFIYFQF